MVGRGSVFCETKAAISQSITGIGELNKPCDPKILRRLGLASTQLEESREVSKMKSVVLIFITSWFREQICNKYVD